MSENNSKKRILVVDDEYLILEMLKPLLESLGYHASLANNGLEALIALSQENFDMVFMDVRMPVMDGFRTIKFLRNCEDGTIETINEYYELAVKLSAVRQGKRIPVVALTGNLGDQEALLDAGMHEFIAKPFNFEEVFNVLKKYCGEPFDCSPKERRRHQRHFLKDNIIVICNNYIGQVVDISESGLAIKYSNHESIPNEWNATFLHDCNKGAIPELPMKLTRQGEKNISPLTGIKTQIIGAEFKKLDAFQKQKITQFIYSLS